MLGYRNAKATCKLLKTLWLDDEKDEIRSRIREFRKSGRDHQGSLGWELAKLASIISSQGLPMMGSADSFAANDAQTRLVQLLSLTLYGFLDRRQF